MVYDRSPQGLFTTGTVHHRDRSPEGLFTLRDRFITGLFTIGTVHHRTIHHRTVHIPDRFITGLFTIGPFYHKTVHTQDRLSSRPMKTEPRLVTTAIVPRSERYGRSSIFACKRVST